MPPLSWMPGAVNFFLLPFMHLPLLFYIYLHFKKSPSLDAPSLDARGRRTPALPPLHATVLDRCLVRTVHVQWRAEGLGCPGPTRFLDAHKLKKMSLSIRLQKFLTTFF